MGFVEEIRHLYTLHEDAITTSLFLLSMLLSLFICYVFGILLNIQIHSKDAPLVINSSFYFNSCHYLIYPFISGISIIAALDSFNDWILYRQVPDCIRNGVLGAITKSDATMSTIKQYIQEIINQNPQKIERGYVYRVLQHEKIGAPYLLEIINDMQGAEVWGKDINDHLSKRKISILLRIPVACFMGAIICSIVAVIFTS